MAALATLDGLASPIDPTVGPIVLGADGRLDVGYEASAPLGDLRVQVEAATTGPLGALRGELSLAALPASLRVVGVLGDVTTVDASAPVGAIAATVTGADEGFLAATLSNVPEAVDVVVDVPARHLESSASAPIGSLALRARVPFEGRQWRAFAELTGVPASFNADFGDGAFAFRLISGSGEEGPTTPAPTRPWASTWACPSGRPPATSTPRCRCDLSVISREASSLTDLLPGGEVRAPRSR